MILNEQQRQVGKDNFADALKMTRRDLIPALVTVPSVTAFYWGYSSLRGNPVRAALIGAGGQGRSHIDSINPDYIKLVAFSDIRPSMQKKARVSLEGKFGSDARHIELIEDYHKLLDRDDIEMVIIALPLHLHAPCTIEAMQKGKHVLCEKLMAKTVTDCKRMGRAAKQTGRLLAIGHQRHYSYLYANALEVAKQKDILGDVRHIRAFWHRNQTGGGKPGAEKGDFDTWFAKVPAEDKQVDFARYGYKSLDELVRWRLQKRTGEGLMAELGSHQLDACSILLKAVLNDKDTHGGKTMVHPRAVSGVGVNSYFSDGREVEDHIFLTYEYPGDTVVTYSSITTNEADGYGEQVMGSKGTLAILSERDVYLLKEKSLRDTRISWAERRISQPSAVSTSTAQWTSGGGLQDTLTSRGYREEQEHLAWLIRHPGEGQPRCGADVGLADAVVTLVSNMSARQRRRIEFKPSWFDLNSDDAPETA
ncbi:Gfo/Idh/MocA family protein [Paludibaculum fermentans]|uniref:Gfo/Idh/MocA family protein n=1 Tax=Paludibaculum fermentans TaxID=1473598 RepID=UPI003EBCD0C5